MKEKLIKKLEEIDKLWRYGEDERYWGEDPQCVDLCDEIEEIMRNMKQEEIEDVIGKLDKTGLEEICLAMEELVEERKFFAKYICKVYDGAEKECLKRVLRVYRQYEKECDMK